MFKQGRDIYWKGYRSKYNVLKCHTFRDLYIPSFSLLRITGEAIVEALVKHSVQIYVIIVNTIGT